MNLERFQHAISLRDEGSLEEAATELHSMATSSSDMTDAERGLLFINEEGVLAQLNRIEEARHCWNEANRLLSGHNQVRLLVDYDDACLCMAERRPEDALRKFDAMLKRHSDALKTPEDKGYYSEIQLRRGLLLVELERHREARPNLEEVLSLEVEKDGAFYFSLGICYMHSRETGLSVQQFLEGLRLGLPEHQVVQAHYYLGTLYYRMGSYGKALQEFEFCETNAGESRPPLGWVYSKLASTCRKLGLQEDAERYSKLIARN